MIGKGFCQICRRSVAPEDPENRSTPDGGQDAHASCVMRGRKDSVVRTVQEHLLERHRFLDAAMVGRYADHIRGDHDELVQIVAQALERREEEDADPAVRDRLGALLFSAIPERAREETVQRVIRRLSVRERFVSMNDLGMAPRAIGSDSAWRTHLASPKN